MTTANNDSAALEENVMLVRASKMSAIWHYLLFTLENPTVKRRRVQNARLEFRGVALVSVVENVGIHCLMDHLEPRYSPQTIGDSEEHISCRLKDM